MVPLGVGPGGAMLTVACGPKLTCKPKFKGEPARDTVALGTVRRVVMVKGSLIDLWS